MSDFEERHERGRAMYDEVNGMEAPAATSPFIEATVDLVFGEIWTRPGLTRKERRWIALTAVASSGAQAAMQVHVRTALESGDITIDELRELVLQLAVYQGWPRAVTLHLVVEEAGAGMAGK
jgi:4-carboxymuconolactone decarboxylase